MDVPSKNSDDYFCHQKFCHAQYSFKRSCFFLFFFVLLIILLVGIATLVILFGLKPQSPVFSLQTVTLDLYKLNSYLNSTLFVSSVFTLTLNVQNPNKLGIRYSPSQLHVYFEGTSIGTIRVPGFLQPSHSYNKTVPTRLLFQCVNVSHILARASSQEESPKNVIQLKILGDVKAQLLAFHVTLLTIKVSLECDIHVDVKQLTIKNEVYNLVKNHMASFPANYPHTIFRKCRLAFFI